MMNCEQLKSDLSYEFKNTEWVKTALCHKSYAKENPEFQHNEKLEFLGDAVIDLVVSDLLMQKYQADQEGNLSRKRASIVNEERLCEISRKFNLPEHLLLGKSERDNHLDQNPRILASAFEAVVGAIYKDAGFPKTFEWVENAFRDVIEESFSNHDFEKDYKTRFQEWVQEHHKVTPNYKLVSQEGPDHARVFKMEVFVKGKLWGEGQGQSKKSAAQDAAKNALEGISK